MDGPNNNHAESIDTDLYVPNSATPTHREPVVIYANGFGGAKDDASGVAIGKWLVSHCYIVLAYSSSGFGNSGGCIELDSPQYDVKDVQGLLDWLVDSTRNSKASDVLTDSNGPIVGMTGGSYGGGIQLLSAEFDSRIRAITPFRTWNSLNYSLTPQHLGSEATLYDPTQPPGVVKYDWTTLFFLAGATGHNQCPAVTLPPGQPAGACSGFPQDLCNAYLDTTINGVPSAQTQALLANSSPLSYLTPGSGPTGTNGHIGLHVPTLLGQGQSDTLFNLDEAVATYRFLRSEGKPTALIWHEGGHGYTDQPGEGDLFDSDQSNPDQKYLPQRILAWFDRYLRGDTSVDPGRPFAYFQDWTPYSYTTDPAVLPYSTANDFPFEATQTFALSGSKDLLPPGQSPTTGSAAIVNPVNPGVNAPPVTGYPYLPDISFTECSNFQQAGSTYPGGMASPCPAQPPYDPPTEFAAFTSPPFPADETSVGIPTAHLHVSNLNTQNNGLMLFAKVFDVAPDGSSVLIHRLIAPFRAPSGGGTVDVYLDGFAHQFAGGHSVRFMLAATDSTSFNNRLPDTITITTGGQDPSTFTLPLAASPLPGSFPETPFVPGLPMLGLPLAAGYLLWRRRRSASAQRSA
jgi:ABC-2 type transport system ATP-binding protein